MTETTVDRLRREIVALKTELEETRQAHHDDLAIRIPREARLYAEIEKAKRPS